MLYADVCLYCRLSLECHVTNFGNSSFVSAIRISGPRRYATDLEILCLKLEYPFLRMLALFTLWRVTFNGQEYDRWVFLPYNLPVHSAAKMLLMFTPCRTRKFENARGLSLHTVQHVCLYRAKQTTPKYSETANSTYCGSNTSAEFQHNIRLRRTIVRCTCRRNSVELVEP